MAMTLGIKYKGYKGSRAIQASMANLEVFRETGISMAVANVVYKMTTSLKLMILKNAYGNEFTFEELSEKWKKEKEQLATIIENKGANFNSWLFTGQLIDAIHYKVNGKEFENEKEMYNHIRALVKSKVKRLRMDIGVFKGTVIDGYELHKDINTGSVSVEKTQRDAYGVALALEYGSENIPPRPLFTSTFNSEEYKQVLNEASKRYKESIVAAWRDTRTYMLKGGYEPTKKERDKLVGGSISDLLNQL